MYTSYSVENFRCFKNLKIENLAAFNLISGKNNSGKTSLLESLWLHCYANDPELGWRVTKFRGVAKQDGRNFLADLFYDFELQKEISLSAEGSWGGKPRKLTIKSSPPEEVRLTLTDNDRDESSLSQFDSRWTEFSSIYRSGIVLNYTDESGKNYESRGFGGLVDLEGYAPRKKEGFLSDSADWPNHPTCVFLNSRKQNIREDMKRFSKVLLDGHQDEVVKSLQMIDKRIRNIDILSVPTFMFYVRVSDLTRPIPISFMGEGTKRFLSIYLAFHEARNGVLLIDEFENCFHHSVLKKMLKYFYELSQRLNVQVFATTHSLDMLEAANEAFLQHSDDFSYYRLDWKEGELTATNYPFYLFQYTVENEVEIR